MGNKNSDLQQDFIQDPRFGLIKLEHSPTANSSDFGDSESQDDNFIVMRISYMKTNYQQWKNKLNSYKSIKEFLLMPVQSQIVDKSLCGSSCIIQAKFPAYRILLRDQVLNRLRIDQPYSQSQVWYFLYNLIVVGAHFEEKNIKIGNVHPKNIVINEKGYMKVIGQVSLPYQTDNFTQVCNSQLNDVFLAPQEIDYDCFDRFSYPSHIDANKAQLFSIGMTILQVGTLQLSTHVYSRGPYKINSKRLQENLNIFKANYSNNLYQMLQNLLSVKPSSRKSCSSWLSLLKPYEDKILNLQNFRWKDRRVDESMRSSEINSQGYLQENSIIPKQLAETKIIRSNMEPVPTIYFPVQFQPKPNHYTVQHHRQYIETSGARSETNIRKYDNHYKNIIRRNVI